MSFLPPFKQLVTKGGHFSVSILCALQRDHPLEENPKWHLPNNYFQTRDSLIEAVFLCVRRRRRVGSRRQFGKSPKSRFNFITMGSCFDSFFFGGHFFAPKDNIIEDPLSHGLAYGGCWICLAIRTQADGLNSFFPDIAGAFSRVQQHRFGCFQTWLITQYEVSQHSSFL